MPNWCSNTLMVFGPEAKVEAFKEAAEGPDQTYLEDGQEKLKEGQVSKLSFHQLVPVPEEVRRRPYSSKMSQETLVQMATGEKPEEPIESLSGYEAEHRLWGCKWGASGSSVAYFEPGILAYSYDTPWSPPGRFLETVARARPSLSLANAFAESGNQVRGVGLYQGQFKDIVDLKEEFDAPSEEDCDSEEEYVDEYFARFHSVLEPEEILSRVSGSTITQMRHNQRQPSKE